MNHPVRKNTQVPSAPKKLWVSTSDLHGIKNQIWDTSHPLLLRQNFPYELVFEDETVILVPRNQHGNKTDFTIAQKEEQTTFSFSDRKKIVVRPANVLPPVYADLSGARDTPSRSSLVHLYAMSGVGKVLTGIQEIGNGYVGYFREKPLFSITQDAQGYSFKALLSGVRVKSSAGLFQEIAAGKTISFDHKNIRSLEIQWDLSWWRFNLIQAPLEMICDSDVDTDPSSGTFKFSVAATAAVLIGFLSLAWFGPQIPAGTLPAALEKAVAPAQTKVDAAPTAEIKKEEVHEVKVVKLPPKHFKPFGADGGRFNAHPGGSGGSAPPGDGKGTPDGGRAPAPKLGTIDPSEVPKEVLAAALARQDAPAGVPAPASGIGLPGVKGFKTKGGVVSSASLSLSPEAKSAQILARNADVFKEALGGVVASLQGAPVNNKGVVGGTANTGALFNSAANTMPKTNINIADIGVANGSPNGRIGGIAGGFGNGTGIRLSGKAGGAYVGTGVGWGAGSGMGHGSGNGTGTGIGTGNGKGDGIGDGEGSGSPYGSTNGKGNGSVTGGLSKQEVGAVIYAHMSEVKSCYENALSANPNLEGRIMVHFTISIAGVAKNISPLDSSVSDKRVEMCIMKRLGLWNFPKPRENSEVDVSYPFIFKMLERQ